jgi:mono/diheme cytochrome c family protein
VRRAAGAFAALAAAVMIASCHDPMQDRGRIKPLEPSATFPDGMSARPTVPGTIPRGALAADAHLDEGRIAGALADRFPMPVTRELLDRGRERYGIFCAPCHDATGSGRGMVVRRGFRAPASFHEQRLRDAADGHFVDAIRNGFGAMPAYRAQVGPADRWAVTAWIRVLQLSQRAPVSLLTAAERGRLEEKRR